ncbi:MAG: hypothetical protein RXR52_09470, partial [Paraburkholderia sp.]
MATGIVQVDPTNRVTAISWRATLRILMMRLVKFRLPRATWTISCASATRQAAARVAPALAAALLGAMSLGVTPAHAASAIAQYDQPKYPANFTHFDYADPDAPNTGTLNFENYNELQSYDSLNPF